MILFAKFSSESFSLFFIRPFRVNFHKNELFLRALKIVELLSKSKVLSKYHNIRIL